MHHTDDWYAILQVDAAAEPEVVEAAYKRLAQKYHPDVSADPDATAIMQRLNEAYEVLSDPKKRSAFDRQRRREARQHQQQARTGPFPPRPNEQGPDMRDRKEQHAREQRSSGARWSAWTPDWLTGLIQRSSARTPDWLAALIRKVSARTPDWLAALIRFTVWGPAWPLQSLGAQWSARTPNWLPALTRFTVWSLVSLARLYLLCILILLFVLLFLNVLLVFLEGLLAFLERLG